MSRSRKFLPWLSLLTLLSISHAFAQGINISIQANSSNLGSTGYGTNPLVVPPNTQVTWKNDDSMPHTVTADDQTFDSGTLQPGATFQHTFTTPGTFSYHCTIPGHNMQGAVQVQAAGASPGPSPSASATS